jgi:hypothetical protein
VDLLFGAVVSFGDHLKIGSIGEGLEPFDAKGRAEGSVSEFQNFI